MFRIRLQSSQSEPIPADSVTTEYKYLVAQVPSKVPMGPNACIQRSRGLAFDRVPHGDWVIGRLSAGEDGKLKLVSTETGTAKLLEDLGLRSAESAWCGTIIDLKGLPRTFVVDHRSRISRDRAAGPEPTDVQCMDSVFASVIQAPTQVQPGTTPTQVVRVVDWVPGHWVGVQNEARTHEIIQFRDPGLAPRLLAHATENHSRVVGFLLEHIPNAREAELAALTACKAALARLHALGIVKRQLSRHSFLVREDGSVLVRGPFDGSPEEVEWTEDLVRAEMSSLEEVLARPSKVDGQAARVLGCKRTAILQGFEKSDGFLVPLVYWQESFEGGGRTTLTEE